MVQDNNASLTDAGDHHVAMIPDGRDADEELYSRRVQLLTFVVAGAACWLPFIGLAYYFI